MISIWKYKDAPQQLKGLYSRARSIEWVLKSPPELVLEVEVLLEQGAATEEIGKAANQEREKRQGQDG